MAGPIGTVACNDGGGDAGPSRDGSKGEACAAITSNHDRGAAGLTDAVSHGARESERAEEREGNEEEGGGRELHGDCYGVSELN